MAADVCKALDHTNTAMALERLDDDEKYKFSLGLSGGDTWCVNEPGLYSLVRGGAGVQGHHQCHQATLPWGGKTPPHRQAGQRAGDEYR